MRAVTKVSLVCIAVTSLAVSAGVPADATDEATRDQLVALKKLCDEGLVSPDVCKEKQRELLGLTPRASEPPARGAAPSPRGATRAAPSSEDALGARSPRKGREAKEPVRRAAGDRDGIAERVHESPLGFRMRLSVSMAPRRPRRDPAGLCAAENQIGSNPEAKRAWERVIRQRGDLHQRWRAYGIQARDGAVPQNASDGATVCQQLSSAIAKLTSRPVTMHECGLRTVAGVPIFYVDHDGVGNGTRTMQFWLEKVADEAASVHVELQGW